MYLSFAGVNVALRDIQKTAARETSVNRASNSCTCKKRGVELQEVSLVLFCYTQGRVWTTQRIL